MTPDENTLPVQEPVETETESPEYDYGSERMDDVTYLSLGLVNIIFIELMEWLTN